MFQRIKERIKTTRQIRTIKKSVRFNSSWYLEVYPDVAESGIHPAEHYLIYGWKEGRDPSEEFATKEYLEINKDVTFCPLYHYEKHGKYEKRRCRYNIAEEPKLTFFEAILMKTYTTLKGIEERIYNKKVHICKKKVLFATYQQQYVCNPKYICEELLKRGSKCDIVWLYDEKESTMAAMPKGIRFIQFNSKEAREEISSAHVIVENGVLLYDWKLRKKKGQIEICTWHSSILTKKIGKDTVKTKEEMYVAKMYSKVHDIVLTNSAFESQIFRSAFWSNSELWQIGHPRNDILCQLQDDPIEIGIIKEKVCQKLKIPAGYNLVLYAPTFRDTDRYPESVESYTEEKMYSRMLDYHLLQKALENRFGGNWKVLVRHHYVNRHNKNHHSKISENIIFATEYDDMQELIIAADVGITDYSSWISDFLLTGKPGFLFAPDEDLYAIERGFYFPLSSTPFPLAHTTEELCNNIESFDNESYQKKKNEFLSDKGCVENGTASQKVVDRILEIIEDDAG